MEGFGICNFRSFDDNGVILENPKKINIIIGKNNSGKSNVLRFLQLLNFHIKDLSKFPSDLKNQFRRNGRQTNILIKVKGENLICDKGKVSFPNGFYKHLDSYFYVNYNIISQKATLPEIIHNLSVNELIFLQKKYASGSKQHFIAAIEEELDRYLKIKIHDYFHDLIYIPHLRVIQEGHNFGDSNSSINGSNIISKMFQMQNPVIGDESSRKKFDLIRSFVRDLVNKPELEIEIPHTKESIVLTIDDNRLPLESFGTGIHQLVLLCSALVIHENSIVCIEEPEIHLHPELQRKFISFLNKTKNTYYITTHSNIFLDSRFETSVYHVQNDGIKSSIFHATRNEKTFNILNDLGYQSSDILQANGVIWVEGPSDRTYITKWLSLVSPDLIEGLHYIIMFYGGRLLAQLSFENEKIVNDLIPLLRLNRNAFVIMDRDGFSSQVKINATKTRIKSEIGDKLCWITKGREIENYLTLNTLCKWLKTDSLVLNSNNKLETDVAPKKYDLYKSKYSKEIVSHISSEDLETLDLKLRLNQLVKQINIWNN